MSPRTQSRSTRERSKKLPDNKRKKAVGTRRKGGIARSRLPTTKKRQYRKLSGTSTDESEGVISQPNGDGKEQDDNDEADDETDVSAPSYRSTMNSEAGLLSVQKKQAKKPDEFDTEEEQDAFFADSEDDDEIYDGVDDISDDDEDVDAIAEGEYLAAQFVDHPDVAANLLGEVDGFSVLGLDNDVDRNSFSSSSDSSEEAIVERHVHFDSEIERLHIEAEYESPRTTAFRLFEQARPMAPGFSQEELLHRSHVEEMQAAHRAFLGELDPDEDSDVTDDDLPAEAHTDPSALQQNPTPMDIADSETSPAEKKEKQSSPRRRGPLLGLFEFDGDKPWAVLDPSGTKVHIAPARDTNRHDWLEKKGRHAMNQALGISSADSSPQGSFATLLDDSDCSVASYPGNGDQLHTRSNTNLMMSGLGSGDALVNPHGFPTGPPEAFYAPDGAHVLGDYLISPEDLDQDDDDLLDPTGEARLSIHDFIEFDGEDDEDDVPTSPKDVLEPSTVSTPNHRKSDSWSHLNSDNVLSFRRNAVPSSASRNQPWNFDLPPRTPVPNFSSSPIVRKRKARSPPYQGEHYRGVTVVERKLITPNSKRRRANTTQ